ncbi:MAG: serine/threonine protein kinase [Xanthomonadales bacterium]|nr:serine/threonine protein kinase [Xanthomonadales bacterium]
MRPFEELEAAVDRLLALAPDGRAAALAELAAVSADLARDAAGWLEDIEASRGFLETAPARQSGQRVGPWSLLRPIGRGGMGEVWLAERADGSYRKQVAIKFFRTDRAGTARRLEQERQVLARLVHPAIARLLDAGDDPALGPFLVTDWIDGQPLDRWLETRQPDRATRLAVFRAIADAVSLAHRELVVHRDIKPANILVDGADQPFLLDFGIAKVLSDGAGPSETQDLAATPHCAAPEQLRGEPVGTRTDVYALGALLHRVLSGRDPLALSGLPIAELVRRVCEEVPAPATRDTGQPDADLDAICRRCLEKEPDQRYPGVDALIADLDAWSNGQPVAARQGGSWYRARKFLRRNRWAVSAAAAVLLAILAGAATTAWQAREAAREAVRATAVRTFLMDLFATIDPEVHHGQPVPAEALVAEGERRVRAETGMEPALRHELLKMLARMRLDLRQYEPRRANLEAACPLADQVYGAGHELAITCRIEWADSLRQLKQTEAAEQVLAAALQQLGTGTPLPAVEALAQEVQFMVDRDQGEPQEAERAIRRSLALARSAEPEPGVQTLNSSEQYAMFLQASGRMDEAEPLLRAVLDFDAAHPDRRSRTEQLNTQWNLLSSWWARERYADLAPAIRQLTSQTERNLGQNHATWFRLRQLAANVTARFGDPRTAVALREATDTTEGIADLGDGRFRQMLWADQVIDLAAIGRTDAAMAMATRTLEWTETRRLPPAPWFIASYGALYAALLAGDQTSAERWKTQLDTAFADLDQNLQGPYRKFLDQAHAAFALRTGDASAAEAAIERAIAVAQPAGAPSTHAVERIRAQRAFLLVDLGRWNEAAAELETVRAALVKRLGPDHPSLLQIDAARAALPEDLRGDLTPERIEVARAGFEAVYGRAPDRVRLW